MNWSKWIKLFALLSFAFGVYVGCSEVEFEQVKQTPKGCDDFTGDCYVDEDGFVLYSDSVRAGEVDILFITDNSGSMYSEQKHMADRFPHFIDSISNLDYQIALTTTDISASPGNSTPREANGWGAFQDGKFLKFPNGSTIISASTPDVVNEFRKTVKRPESLKCDSNGYASQYCPSGDERAIYAANMVLDRADSNFFREGAHFAVVILSDEDERSNGGAISGYPIQTYDKPETLVSKLKQSLGPAKTMSVHSVIINPRTSGGGKDTHCYNKQNNQGSGVKGFYGYHYAYLSEAGSKLRALGNIVRGHKGSICASDYGAELGDIASSISDNTNMIQLACTPVVEEGGEPAVEVSFDPAPPYQITYDVDSDNRLILDPPAPAGVTVHFQYKCYRYD